MLTIVFLLLPAGKSIEFSKSFSHLDHHISADSNDNEAINQVSNAICYFSKLTSSVKIGLFQGFCTRVRAKVITK